jgi:hypothetical protein
VNTVTGLSTDQGTGGIASGAGQVLPPAGPACASRPRSMMAAGVRTRTKSTVRIGWKIEFGDADSPPYQVVLQVGELPQTLRRPHMRERALSSGLCR